MFVQGFVSYISFSLLRSISLSRWAFIFDRAIYLDRGRRGNARARARRNEISKATADRINCRPKERSDARFCARSPPVICKGHRRNPRATDTRGKEERGGGRRGQRSQSKRNGGWKSLHKFISTESFPWYTTDLRLYEKRRSDYDRSREAWLCAKWNVQRTVWEEYASTLRRRLNVWIDDPNGSLERRIRMIDARGIAKISDRILITAFCFFFFFFFLFSNHSISLFRISCELPSTESSRPIENITSADWCFALSSNSMFLLRARAKMERAMFNFQRKGNTDGVFFSSERKLGIVKSRGIDEILSS